MKQKGINLWVAIVVIVLAVAIFILLLAGKGYASPLAPTLTGCTLYSTLEFGKEHIDWGGYINEYPYKLCGVAVEVGGVWEVVTWESAGGCVASTNTSRQCIQLVGGGYIQLIDRMSESGVPVHGWMAVVQGATAGAVYIPAETQAAEMHRTFLPLVSGIGWGGPPPLPTEEEQK